MNPLETYLTALRDIRSSGAAVDETSYYGALETLFNEVGKSLKPKVQCIPQLKNRGVGSPDIGFYTEDQYKNKPGQIPIEGQSPARGVVEVKPTSDDAWLTADGEQVSRYWSKYRQVLVTNYRDFVFVGQDSAGKPVKLETYRLADSEAAFWDAAFHPKKTSDRHGEMLVEFAKRAMLHAAPLTTPQDLAWFLASYARDALARIGLHELPALAGVRKALEEALGLTFEGEKGEHFFRSTLIQTLFYGVFSAWVLWSKQNPPSSNERFDWRNTAYFLRVPVLRKLFHEVAEPGQLEALNLSEILGWTSGVLNRVDRGSFFAKFQEAHAVQYFYEPFLQAYDPELRKQLGVWYTPPEIVQYMVARVDTVLREELKLPDGLANKNVYILDPCCGTGSYLVEVLKKIHEILQQRGNDALIAADLKDAAKHRVFGFEILPAPFVVSHLQLGLLLQNLGAPLTERGDERISVFLTNALTGWEPPKEPKTRLLYKELEDERDAAEHIKRDTPILVILGNPPYNSFAGVAVKEERALTEAYKSAKRAPAPQGQGLNDLYVRFFRMAERRIVEKTGKGIVCFISNYSWLESLSCTAMRERYLEVFDQIWIDNLHGDRIISEYAPDGRTSETIFAMRGSSPGITIGTAVSLLAANPDARKGPHSIFYRDFDTARAGERRADLLASLKESKANTTQQYQKLLPILELGLPLKPRIVQKHYLAWPLLTFLFPTIFPGVKTSRDDFLVDIDREKLVKRLNQYFEKKVGSDEMRRISATVMSKTKRFDAQETRRILLERGFLPTNVIRYAYRPFDVRWLYWEPETKLLDEKRSEYFPHVSKDNLWAVSQQKPRREWSQPQAVRSIGCLDLMDRGASCIPLYLKSSQNPRPLLQEPPDPRDLSDGKKFNISDLTLLYLSNIGTVANSEDLFYHTLAVMHAPEYRRESAGGLRQDWPRIPLPNAKKMLVDSGALGRRLSVLLDTESSAEGVTTREQRPELKLVGTITRVGGGSLAESDLCIRAGWGRSGKRGATMPSKGKLVERDYSPSECKHILEGAAVLGLSENEILAHLGEKTCDVYLNDIAYWSNIPIKVWDYTIGGYQVIKKWLSYREKSLLGRPLSKDEVRYVQEMARRIAAILLLEPALDANYESVKKHTYPWPLKGVKVEN